MGRAISPNDLLQAMSPDPDCVVEVNFYDRKGNLIRNEDARVLLGVLGMALEEDLVQVIHKTKGRYTLVNTRLGRVLCVLNRPIPGVRIVDKPSPSYATEEE